MCRMAAPWSGWRMQGSGSLIPFDLNMVPSVSEGGDDRQLVSGLDLLPVFVWISRRWGVDRWPIRRGHVFGGDGTVGHLFEAGSCPPMPGVMSQPSHVRNDGAGGKDSQIHLKLDNTRIRIHPVRRGPWRAAAVAS